MRPYLLALAVSTSVTALLYARFEYRKRGRLSWFGVLLLLAMFFVPNFILHYSASYELPDSAAGYAAAFVAFIGLSICLAGIVSFRSLQKMLCLDAGELTESGPYRWSRNPQYLGWNLFILGFALMYPSSWTLAAFMVVAVSIHGLILVEEEHLRRTFGGSYDEFCRRTARYFGIWSILGRWHDNKKHR